MFDVYRTVTVDKKLKELTNKPDQFQDFDFISLWQIRFDNAIAITVFIAWVKVFINQFRKVKEILQYNWNKILKKIKFNLKFSFLAF